MKRYLKFQFYVLLAVFGLSLVWGVYRPAVPFAAVGLCIWLVVALRWINAASR